MYLWPNETFGKSACGKTKEQANQCHVTHMNLAVTTIVLQNLYILLRNLLKAHQWLAFLFISENYYTLLYIIILHNNYYYVGVFPNTTNKNVIFALYLDNTIYIFI